MTFIEVIVAVVVFLIIWLSLVGFITINEGQRGVMFRRGRFVRVLEPGQFQFYKGWTSITVVDTRQRFFSIKGQEILTNDGIPLKVSLAVIYDITDPEVAVISVEKYQDALRLTLQMSLREIVGSVNIDELMGKRGELGTSLGDIVAPVIEKFGLRLIAVNIKDIMFPADVRRIFTQEIYARKEALANLEKARGETAGLRAMANVARMVEKNPGLMQLRLLQTLDNTRGNTFVIGLPVEVGLIEQVNRPDSNSEN